MPGQVTTPELLARNENVASKHDPLPTLADWEAQGIARPNTLIVSCSDPRSDPAYIFNLTPGEALILRSVGGQVRPLVNDILALDRFAGFERILILHHTDCGALYFTSDEVRKTLQDRDPELKGLEHDHLGGIPNLEQSVKNDVALLKSLKVMREELKPNIDGFVFDIKTGKATKVAE